MLRLYSLRASHNMMMVQANARAYWLDRKSEKKCEQKYKSFLILDFEATCEKGLQLEPQEIIEFPCIKLSSKGEVEGIFHTYIRPEVHPILSPYCTELTGVMQCMVNDAPRFAEVFSQFKVWLEDTKTFGPGNESIFVTSGDWDLKVMFPEQCKMYGIDIPSVATHWINIKKAYCDYTGYFPRGIADMVSRLGLPYMGKAHRGLDDCKNIVNIMKYLLKQGFLLEETSIDLDPRKGGRYPKMFPSGM